jgi:hypothetical protein
MTDFFGEPSPSDATYRVLQSADNPRTLDARTFVETLWRKTEPYLDAHVRSRAARQFHQAFWEIYLCAALLDLRLPVTPRDFRRRRDQGPDLQLGDVDAWCEAIAVTAGDGPDAVEEAVSGQIRAVPHDAIKLRLTAALNEKKRKFEGYATSGFVSDAEPCIVAINAALVPSSTVELDVPRIVASVFGFGWPTVVLDEATGTIRPSSYTHQPEVAKANDARVSSAIFLTQECSAVSAVLCSCADHLNRPATLGADFILVHNPNATTPLRRSFIPRGREYWKQGDQLLATVHGRADT